MIQWEFCSSPHALQLGIKIRKKRVRNHQPRRKRVQALMEMIRRASNFCIRYEFLASLLWYYPSYIMPLTHLDSMIQQTVEKGERKKTEECRSLLAKDTLVAL